MLSVAKVDISIKYDNRITIFCYLEYGFLGISQRLDIKQESGINDNADLWLQFHAHSS